MRYISSVFATSLLALAFLACKAAPTPPLTAEEAGWQSEILPVVASACGFDANAKSQTPIPAKVPCGLGEVNCYGTKTIMLSADYHMTSMPAPKDAPATYWVSVGEQMHALLPPKGLEKLHASITDVVDAQLSLHDTTSPLTGDQRSQQLGIDAKSVCSQFIDFRASVAKRRAPATPTPSAPSLSVSFQPIGLPTSFGLNHKGEFSISITDSIPTPYGNLSFSASKSTASATAPKRLVIRSDGKHRILVMDRDFTVFVPSSHGVQVSNSDAELVLDVDAMIPATRKKQMKNHNSRG